ncbi:4-amino-4-deoxy-L-arabinose transferase [Nakamurella panacisegetis]|uniref:4-amino-4-deoxy-L-arabinose transferase n=1 Tax=Nakamurella panacisegetis TaxID=1090615 RepID=A0A1H0J1S2_9ACTN|nr:glycosyltransferase family 39 protein [Nakamurella panacisegetis]SDO37389.1 4-amino-4-deoxy-L-arabinose transferase [Nakamurella panacisegetis]
MTATLEKSPPVAEPPGPAEAPAPPRRRLIIRIWRGGADDPRWARPALFGLLAVTAVLYLVNLTASGWANAFYSAAAQAGSVSWKAFFFGSSDAGNAITVDKTPGSLWFMALSARLFGVNSFAILLPQAFMGIASVGVLYSTVKRVATPMAGLLAGLALAVTPVAALMFRFNNPDAMMVLCLVLGAWAMTQAIATGRTKWLLWCGAFIGFAFLAKMMQAFLVVPGFGLAYLVAGPPRLRRRIGQLVGALVAMIVAGGWWVAVVMLWAAADRPYIGGSQTNSVLDLLFGYNGFGRLTGDEVGSVGWTDQASPTKLIDSEMGGQIAWLLPAALVALIAGLVITARRKRTDPVRASLIIWGGWLLVTGITFSAMQGIIHPYYTVALAPAIAALVGIGAHQLWKHRDSPLAIGTMAGTVVVSAVWAKILLARTSDFLPWLGTTVLVVGFVAAAAVLVAGLLPGRRARILTPIAAVLAAAVLLAGPTAYTVDTISTGHTGALPSAGPSSAGGFGGGARPGGTFGGAGNLPSGQFSPGGQGTTSTGTTATARGFGGGGGMGGLLGASTPSATMISTLKANSSNYTWAAAVVGSNNAAGYQLATGLPVMAVGGFNGTDPAPTLAQFQALAKAGKIHYFIAGTISGGGSSSTSGQDASLIAAWVESHYTATTVGSVTIYDLTPGSAS